MNPEIMKEDDGVQDSVAKIAENDGAMARYGGIDMSNGLRRILEALSNGIDISPDRVSGTLEAMAAALTKAEHNSDEYGPAITEGTGDAISDRSCVYDAKTGEYRRIGETKSGESNRNPVIDIVLGAPGFGKSSRLGEIMSNKFKSRLIDGNQIAKTLPGYLNGMEGEGFFEDSVVPATLIGISAGVRNKSNIVLAHFGDASLIKAKSVIEMLGASGYECRLHYIDDDAALMKLSALDRIAIDKDYAYLNRATISDQEAQAAKSEDFAVFADLAKSKYVTGFAIWQSNKNPDKDPLISRCEGSCRKAFDLDGSYIAFDSADNISALDVEDYGFDADEIARMNADAGIGQAIDQDLAETADNIVNANKLIAMEDVDPGFAIKTWDDLKSFMHQGRNKSIEKTPQESHDRYMLALALKLDALSHGPAIASSAIGKFYLRDKGQQAAKLLTDPKSYDKKLEEFVSDKRDYKLDERMIMLEAAYTKFDAQPTVQHCMDLLNVCDAIRDHNVNYGSAVGLGHLLDDCRKGMHHLSHEPMTDADKTGRTDLIRNMRNAYSDMKSMILKDMCEAWFDREGVMGSRKDYVIKGGRGFSPEFDNIIDDNKRQISHIAKLGDGYEVKSKAEIEKIEEDNKAKKIADEATARINKSVKHKQDYSDVTKREATTKSGDLDHGNQDGPGMR